MTSASVIWPETSWNDLLIASNMRGAKATTAFLSTPSGTVPTSESPVLWLNTQPVTSGQQAIRSVTSLSEMLCSPGKPSSSFSVIIIRFSGGASPVRFV